MRANARRFGGRCAPIRGVDARRFGGSMRANARRFGGRCGRMHADSGP